MKYYKFVADTPYCGTESTYYEAYETEPTEKELNETAADYCHDNAESYDYMVFGWDADPVGDGEMTEEEYADQMDDYYADCSCYWEEISESEYRENTEG